MLKAPDLFEPLKAEAASLDPKTERSPTQAFFKLALGIGGGGGELQTRAILVAMGVGRSIAVG